MSFNKWFYLLIESKAISYQNIKHRFLNLILVICIVLFAGFIAEDLLVKGLEKRILASFSGLLFTSILYYFSRFRRIFTPVAVVFFVFMLFVFLPLLWSESGGMIGVLPFFFILYTVAIVFIFEGRWRVFFLSVAFVVAVALSIWDLFHYVEVGCSNVSTVRFINRSVAFFFVAIALALFTSFALGRYKSEKLKAESLSKVDYLTGLFNRREGMERLNYLINYLEREEKRLSIIMMDIDDFKKVNDRYGHICGDMVLKEIADIIKSNIRQTDIAVRWGGEELLIILPNAGKREAFSIAERIRREIEGQRFSCDGNIFHITITGGIASYDFEKSVEKNIASADKALYEGKRQGKNRNIIA
ncbi:GGDEF domain-containing protein [Hippea alviniae]|uniref:GGDEF domain-containing protein n=1 Tax=Hippea alviniae TaxID=1279027 RepID=UPI0006885F08|nr:GGDEF domain-containing protein [Hippea alviniae]